MKTSKAINYAHNMRYKIIRFTISRPSIYPFQGHVQLQTGRNVHTILLAGQYSVEGKHYSVIKAYQTLPFFHFRTLNK